MNSGNGNGNSQVTKISRNWKQDKRWQGILRPYAAADVLRLRGSIVIEHTLA